MKKITIILLLLALGCPVSRAADSTANAKAQAAAAKVKTDSPAKASQPGKNAPAAQPKTGSAAAKPNSAVEKNPCTLADAGSRPLVGYMLIVVIVVFSLAVAWWSNLLKDPITSNADFLAAAKRTVKYKDATDPDKIPRPYSLSRSQLGIWTIVIGCSYLYMQLCRDCCIGNIEIDTGLLTLMGISAGTAALGSVIDSTNNQVVHHQDGPSEGFLMDILSDQNGISIHRFQNVIWTVIAVVIFLCQLHQVECLKLPTLDNNLIALTGISSLTYLGLKINENKPPVPPLAGPDAKSL